MSDRHRDREEEMEEDDEWLFDSIVGYLTSPIWKAPIEHFFEQNCSSQEINLKLLEFEIEFSNQTFCQKNYIPINLGMNFEFNSVHFGIEINKCLRLTQKFFESKK